jgi:hypothetical protein
MVQVRQVSDGDEQTVPKIHWTRWLVAVGLRARGGIIPA